MLHWMYAGRENVCGTVQRVLVSRAGYPPPQPPARGPPGRPTSSAGRPNRKDEETKQPAEVNDGVHAGL